MVIEKYSHLIVRKVPFFLLKCEAVMKAVLNDSMLTTNMVESWDKQFHKYLRSHSVIYKVIVTIFD